MSILSPWLILSYQWDNTECGIGNRITSRKLQELCSTYHWVPSVIPLLSRKKTLLEKENAHLIIKQCFLSNFEKDCFPYHQTLILNITDWCLAWGRRLELGKHVACLAVWLIQVLYPLWAPWHENEENVNVAQGQVEPEDKWQPAGWSVGMLRGLIPDTCPTLAEEDPWHGTLSPKHSHRHHQPDWQTCWEILLQKFQNSPAQRPSSR